MNIFPQPKLQSGVTLIELMISLTIGLVIIAGLGQAFISGKTAYSIQDRLGELQENGRYALYFLQRDVRLAGYPKSGTTAPFSVSSTATCDACSGLNNTSDQIAIQFTMDAAGTRDCLGNSIPSAGGVLPVAVTFTYSISVNSSTSVSQLTCGVTQVDSAGTTTTSAAQPIVDGIEAMQIQYGVDTDTDPTQPGYGYADYYVPASSVPAASWPLGVVAVRIALLASTISPVMGDTAADSAGTYVLLDAAPYGPLPTGVRGRVFVTTIGLRNRAS